MGCDREAPDKVVSGEAVSMRDSMEEEASTVVLEVSTSECVDSSVNVVSRDIAAVELNVRSYIRRWPQ